MQSPTPAVLSANPQMRDRDHSALILTFAELDSLKVRRTGGDLLGSDATGLLGPRAGTSARNASGAPGDDAVVSPKTTPHPEKWIVGVDHERPETEKRARGNITRVCYLEPPTGASSTDVTLHALRDASRVDVVAWLVMGTTVFTAVRDPDESGFAATCCTWVRRAAVMEKDDCYITTEANFTTFDNLGELPTIAAIRAQVKSLKQILRRG